MPNETCQLCGSPLDQDEIDGEYEWHRHRVGCIAHLRSRIEALEKVIDGEARYADAPKPLAEIFGQEHEAQREEHKDLEANGAYDLSPEDC